MNPLQRDGVVQDQDDPIPSVQSSRFACVGFTGLSKIALETVMP